MAENQNGNDNWKSPRFLLASGVLSAAIIGVLLLSIVILSLAPAEKKLETANMVFTAILPLLGTWVGTVLAYYFSKENFESANRNVREMVKTQLTSQEKLKSIPATDAKAMIPLNKMDAFRITKQIPEDKVLLVDGLLDFLNKNKRNRLPILDENDHPRYVIHRSLIDKFLVEKSTANPPTTPDDLKKLTLKNLLETASEDIKRIIRVSFGTVKESDTLADAKLEMERESYRLDVFVTKDGTEKSAVVGWLTNIIITDHARL